MSKDTSPLWMRQINEMDLVFDTLPQPSADNSPLFRNLQTMVGSSSFRNASALRVAGNKLFQTLRLSFNFEHPTEAYRTGERTVGESTIVSVPFIEDPSKEQFIQQTTPKMSGTDILLMQILGGVKASPNEAVGREINYKVTLYNEAAGQDSSVEVDVHLGDGRSIFISYLCDQKGNMLAYQPQERGLACYRSGNQCLPDSDFLLDAGKLMFQFGFNK